MNLAGPVGLALRKAAGGARPSPGLFNEEAVMSETYVSNRKSPYPPQEITRAIEALYLAGVIDDFDEGTCRKWRARIEQSVKQGRARYVKASDRSDHRP